MESSRKRRSSGFVKSKLIPFYRSSKSNSSTNLQQLTYTATYTTMTKVKPSQTSPSTPAVGFVNLNPPQHHMQKQSKPKVSFILPETRLRSAASEKLSHLDRLYGVTGDAAVDIKAATYISSVQERFKLERLNSERARHEDVKKLVD